ncbi:formin-like protein 3 [Setaria italica]|uniref:formin-like protein 3 n=1 Tax=Setaria italica TaxID=4555 RepID=UPI000647C369|nr:formin-like protein 3 [Setaria italica]
MPDGGRALRTGRRACGNDGRRGPLPDTHAVLPERHRLTSRALPCLPDRRRDPSQITSSPTEALHGCLTPLDTAAHPKHHRQLHPPLHRHPPEVSSSHLPSTFSPPGAPPRPLPDAAVLPEHRHLASQSITAAPPRCPSTPPSSRSTVASPPERLLASLSATTAPSPTPLHTATLPEHRRLPRPPLHPPALPRPPLLPDIADHLPDARRRYASLLPTAT